MSAPGPRTGGDGRSPLAHALSALIALAVAGAVVAAVLLNLPVQPPSGLTSPSGKATAPDIRSAVAGRVLALKPAVELAGEAAVTTDFLDATRGWAVVGCGPAGGRICRLIGTDDGGLTWRSLWTTDAPLSGIAFANARVGYAWTGGGEADCAGGECATTLFATANGGRTWTRRSAGSTPLRSVAVTAPGRLWATGGGLLLTSGDGGGTWQIQPTPSCIAGSVRFVGRTGIVVGENSEGVCALRTTDGGRSWSVLLSGLGAPAVRAAFARFLSDSGLSAVLGGPAAVRAECGAGQAWPAGDAGAWLVVRCNPINPDMLAVLYSGDAGGHWRLVWDTAGCTGGCPAAGAGEDPLAFFGPVAWRTDGARVARAATVGGTFGAGGRLCRVAACAPALEALSPTRLVAATGQGVFASTDGGARWQRLWPEAGPGPLDAISLVGAGHGLAVAALDPTVLLATADDGRTWRLWGRLPGGVRASGLDFLSAQVGYVYGTDDAGQPVLLSTTRGARGLKRTPLPESRGRPLALVGLAFRTTADGLALDAFGDAWRTADAGRHWRLVAPLPLGLPQSVAWAAPHSLYAVVAFKNERPGRSPSGHLGLVLSSDGGSRFRPLAAWPWPPAAGDFDSSVVAARGTDVWLFAYGGLDRSTDSGATWTMVRLPAARLAPRALTFANAEDGWLLSQGGVLFATVDGGRTWQQRTRASA